MAEKDPSRSGVDETMPQAQEDNLAQAEATHRQTLLLQAAQRAAERTANLMDQAPEL